jgi:hypothetical protein
MVTVAVLLNVPCEFCAWYVKVAVVATVLGVARVAVNAPSELILTDKPDAGATVDTATLRG